MGGGSCRVCHVFAGRALRPWHDVGGGIGGGGGVGQGKLAAYATVREKRPPRENYHSCACTCPHFSGTGGRGVCSPFSFGWVWWVGGSTTGSAGSAHGLRDLFHEAGRDTDLLVRARWPLRAQPLQLRKCCFACLLCGMGETVRPLSWASFFFLPFFFPHLFFFLSFSLLLPVVVVVAASPAAPIIVNPNSVLWPPVSSPFF